MRINPLVTALGLLALFAASMVIGYVGGQLFLAPAKSAPRPTRGTTPAPVVVETPPAPAAPLGPTRRPDVSTTPPPQAPVKPPAETPAPVASAPTSPVPAASKPTAPQPVAQPTTAIRVQAGAFQKRENADARSAQLRQDGFEPYIVTTGNLFRVIVGAFNDRENADRLLAQLKEKGYDAIVLTVR